jgi:hypothetical protein
MKHKPSEVVRAREYSRPRVANEAMAIFTARFFATTSKVVSDGWRCFGGVKLIVPEHTRIVVGRGQPPDAQTSPGMSIPPGGGLVIPCPAARDRRSRGS